MKRIRISGDVEATVEVPMKLYVSRLSPNARRTLLAKELIDLPIEVVDVDLRKGANKEPWYLAINANHKVPALEDGDFRLWESNAINQYLAHKAGRADLWPTDPAEQADVSRWQFWTHTHWNLASMPIVFERVIKPAFGMGQTDEAAVEAKLPELKVAMQLLEDHLAGREWLSSGRLTLADLSLGGSLSYALPARLPFGDYPRFEAWFARIREMDAWKKTEPPR